MQAGHEKHVLYIPRGTQPGEKIVIEGGFDDIDSQRSRDIEFTVMALSDPVFTKEGAHLKATLTISLKEVMQIYPGCKQRLHLIQVFSYQLGASWV